jgi:hypothetical protein
MVRISTLGVLTLDKCSSADRTDQLPDRRPTLPYKLGKGSPLTAPFLGGMRLRLCGYPLLTLGPAKEISSTTAGSSLAWPWTE